MDLITRIRVSVHDSEDIASVSVGTVFGINVTLYIVISKVDLIIFKAFFLFRSANFNPAASVCLSLATALTCMYGVVPF